MSRLNIKVKFTDSPLGFDPENNVYIRALKKRFHVEYSDSPDLVFYSVFGTEFLNYPKSVRIFLANEPAIPNFNDCDYAVGAFNIQFGERYFRQPPLTGYGEKLLQKLLYEKRSIPESAFNRRFCNFVYSNATNGSGAKKRIDFCQRLAQYRHIDCPGRVLNNMDDGLESRYYEKNNYSASGFNPDWADSKLTFLRDYKFTIAFENVSLRGWTTEKLIHPLIAGSVPIYWGDPDVTDFFNEKAFINCRNEDDFEDIISRVEELDRDKDQYLYMLRQPVLTEKYPLHWEDALADFFEQIVDNGLKPFEKNPMGYASMTAQDYSKLCREGKIGLSSIIKSSGRAMKGWLDYKIKGFKKSVL